MQTIDVLIVGAGPAGLTLACDLLRRGVSFRLIERLRAGSVGSSGKLLQPRTLEIFDDLGLIDDVIAHSSHPPPVRIYQGFEPTVGEVLVPMLESTPDTPYPNVRLQPQWKTEVLLRKHLVNHGGNVEFGTDFESLEQSEEDVRVGIRSADGEETVTARYVVATDGGQERLRQAVGMGSTGGDRKPGAVLMADVRVDGLDPNYCHEWTGPSGRIVTLCPLPRTQSFQFAATIDAAETPELNLDTVQALLDEVTGPPPPLSRGAWAKFLRPVPPPQGSRYPASYLTWISRIADSPRVTAPFRKGRVFLTGDAAHEHGSAGPSGLNISIQDAYDLGWKLEQVLKGADDRLSDPFEKGRRSSRAEHHKSLMT